MSESALLGLPFIAAEQAQKHVTHNEALRALDALVQLSVKDRHLAAPPGGPLEGDRHIVGAGPTGAWAGHAGEIAAWQDGAWAFFAPREGWLAWVEDEDALLAHDGAAWADISSTVAALQNLVLLGVGTTADAANPFSAKLNKALWTAKASAEGGTGDLRYTLNKEAAANVLSLLLQTGFSGRAEFGLIGSDDLSFKVSADGAGWVEAMRVAAGTGALTLGGRLLLPDGSAAAPALASISAAGTGWWNNPAFPGWSFSVAGLETVSNWGGNTPAYSSAGLALTMRLLSEASVALIGEVYGPGTPVNSLRRARGTIAAPALPNPNDLIGTYQWGAQTGGGWGNVVQLQGRVVETTPAASALGAEFRVNVAPLGSAAATEIVRLRHDTGLSMFGANPVIDANRHLRLRSYTVATLPAAGAAAGQMIYCSDLGGGGGQLNSDGTTWRRVSRGGAQTVATDAGHTLTVLTSAEEQRHTGTLTADRSITLSTANAYPGARFRVTRTGGGPFNLNFGGLKNLGPGAWGEAIHDGSTWHLAAYGAL